MFKSIPGFMQGKSLFSCALQMLSIQMIEAAHRTHHRGFQSCFFLLFIKCPLGRCLIHTFLNQILPTQQILEDIKYKPKKQIVSVKTLREN